ncbi:hypothetical protein [Bacillus sp. X1(2014)]|uniref:HTH-like domain-containing protein n=1 Tax=Bacillus sp. X1(2014) TaxID=1565991 RepID=UPI0011A0FFCD|nr:hypothetical protein [Bacillus sp. X1(2014)]
MTVTELGNTLKEMYNSAPEGEQATFIHLFGIKYGELILRNNYRIAEIVKIASIQDSYRTEVRKDVKLSKYVTSNI